MEDISLHSSIDKKPMFSSFFELGNKFEGTTKETLSDEDEDELVVEIKKIIDQYLKD